MKRVFIVIVMSLLASLVLAQQVQQQPAAQQPAAAQPAAQPVDPAQPGVAPTDPRWGDPRFADPRWTAPQWAAPYWGDPLFLDHEVAMVRLAHLSPNSPAVDVRMAWLDGFIPEQQETAEAEAFQEAQAELAGLEYGDVTDYVLVPAGSHSIFVTLPGDELNVLYEREVSFNSGAYYTLAAVGFVLGTDAEIDARVRAEQEAQEEGFFTWLEGLFTDRDPGDLNFRLEIYDDEPGNFPPAGHAHVRVIHAAPGSPNVDVWAWRMDFDEWRAQAVPVDPALVPAPAAPADPAAVPAEPVAAQPTTTQPTTAQPATAEAQPAQLEQEVLGPGDLRITVIPEDASINVVGPNSYVQQFRGSQTLSGLVPGNYIITATRAGYNATSERVSLGAEEGADIELQLEESPGEAAAARRQEQAAPVAAAPADQAAAPAQQPAQQPAEQPAQVTEEALGPGDLRIRVFPEDASINVIGPNSFVQQLRGGQTLSGLMPGNYIITATRAGYNAISERVSLGAEEGADIELQLGEAEGEAAAARRQETTPIAGQPADQAAAPAPAADPAAQPVDPAATAAPIPPDPAVAPGPVDPAIVGQPGFVLINDHAFPFASGYAALRAFDYDLEILVAGSDIVIERFDAVNIEPGTIYTIFITGTAVADYPIEAIVVADVRLVASPAEELMEDAEEAEDANDEVEPEDENND